ncbi:flagellar biosynthetic protein FliR [Virgisporangium aliadipatigenens]|uniref:Flagellar biosynthetic protein FliR n=1 Tax=Virgisporangium aliadipatigenens TaxID=741659 RepID=A0A8J3YRL8_9ACTN|nr:flagellar biosynthetic protein FliR [Virgisporangium aliadipatigenens]GIJ48675.1 flagellar biosynthetic protein FliR [Virgisporangium aliadipatigenens]
MQVQLSLSFLTALLLTSVRVVAWLIVVPPFNSRSVPMRVKALLSVAMALPITPNVLDQVPATSGGGLISATAQQVVVGTGLGFVTALFFSAVQSAGAIIDIFGGFSMASMYDPLSGAQNAVFGRFYNVVATALLFATDGYAMILRGFANSFKGLPLTDTISLDRLAKLLTEGADQMLVAAVQIAGPLVAVLFITDVGLGLLTRVAPQLNVFNIAFPLKIAITIGLAGTAITLLPRAFDFLVDRAVRVVLQVIGAG